MSRGIPTVYRGHQFRSRVEARWAAFFDLLGWTWAYEPFDLQGYIPDFELLGWRERVLVEVKFDGGYPVRSAAIAKARRAGWRDTLLVLGAVPPFHIQPEEIGSGDRWFTIGFADHPSEDTDAGAPAVVACPVSKGLCGSHGLVPMWSALTCLRCGAAAHKILRAPIDPVSLWGRAGAATQWHRAFGGSDA